MCSMCKVELDSSQFYFSKTRNRITTSRCKECFKKFSAKHTKAQRGIIGSKIFWSSKFYHLKRQADMRNRSFTLSFEEYKILKSNKECFYCHQIADSLLSVSIDRVNNSLGYYKDNCVSCCLNCNRSKGKYLTEEEMKTLGRFFMEVRKRSPLLQFKLNVFPDKQKVPSK